MTASKTVVLFATPSYDHRVSYEFFKSSIETEWALTAAGIAHGYIGRGGDQFIAKVRNKLTTEFLVQYPMGTDLFFIDDDVGWPAAKVIEFLNRPEDIVAGIYPKKQETLDFPVELEADKATGKLIERNGLIRATGVPTGFMRIKRHVLEELVKHCGQFHELDADGTKRYHYALFRTGISEDGEFNGEDWTFCQNARAAGFEIWVDPNIPFTHRGNKLWSANLADHLDVFRSKGEAAAQETATHGKPLPASDEAPALENDPAKGDHR